MTAKIESDCKRERKVNQEVQGRNLDVETRSEEMCKERRKRTLAGKP